MSVGAAPSPIVVEGVAQGSVVEEVAQRPSRDVVTRGWDGPSTGLRGLETGREAAFLDHRGGAFVEEVAAASPRSSRRSRSDRHETW